MSAMADLGWEAYPNEGVSTGTTTDTHTNKQNHLLYARAGIKRINLITTSWLCCFISRDSRAESSTVVCFRERWVLKRFLLNRESAGGIYKLFPLRCKRCGTGASIYSGLRFLGWSKGTGWRGKYSYVRRGCCVHVGGICMCVCVCVTGGWGGVA